MIERPRTARGFADARFDLILVTRAVAEPRHADRFQTVATVLVVVKPWSPPSSAGSAARQSPRSIASGSDRLAH
jgi:hypothetical protein